MKTYLRLLGFARPLGWYVPQYILTTLLYVFFSLINFAVLIPVLRLLFNLDSGGPVVTELPAFELTDKYFINLFYYYFGTIIREQGPVEALYFICYILVGSVFLANLFNYLSSLIQASVRVNVIKNLRNQVFEKVTRFDMGYFTETKKGDIMARITTDVQQVEVTVVNTLKVLFKEPVLIIGYFFLLFRMSAELTLYTLLLIPISGGFIGYIAKRLKKRAKRSQESLGRMTGILDETISGMRVIKAFAARTYILDKFRLEVRKYARHNFRISAKFNLAAPVTQIFIVIFLSLILIIGGRMVLNDNSSLSAAEFLVFLIIFGQMQNPTKQLTNAFTNIQKGIASGDRIFELMDTIPLIQQPANPIPAEEIKDHVKFEHVSFAYDVKPVLTDINLEIPKGKSVALVGPSGGGKSTIADLIPRFYDPSAGRILMDGRDIREFDIDSYRRQMGIVTQESILFNDSVKRNIAFGKPDAALDEIREAAKVANAHDFIEQMDDGYDTLIGERGTKLSGGQRQRLSIARAVLKNPPILILDEATSALDSESEKLVQDAIYNLTRNRTTLVIAHRLSTIQNADEIVVIQDGKIIQRGTHSDLLKSGGMYRKLIDIQAV